MFKVESTTDIQEKLGQRKDLKNKLVLNMFIWNLTFVRLLFTIQPTNDVMNTEIQLNTWTYVVMLMYSYYLQHLFYILGRQGRKKKVFWCILSGIITTTENPTLSYPCGPPESKAICHFPSPESESESEAASATS